MVIKEVRIRRRIERKLKASCLNFKNRLEAHTFSIDLSNFSIKSYTIVIFVVIICW